MWKATLQRSIKDVRFVMSATAANNGAWKYVHERLPELVRMNQGTYFTVTEIDSALDTPSGCHLIYGDLDGTMDLIETGGMTSVQFEEALKEKVSFGSTLRRPTIKSNRDRDVPLEIMIAGRDTHYFADEI